MMTAIKLYLEFFFTGLFAVGGGLASLPFLYEISARTGWFTNQDILNLIAISESTPGAIGINMSTYAGFVTMGIGGGILATLALISPSIIIIVMISKVLEKFRDSKLVQGIFKGLRPASTGLIAAAGLGVAKLALLHTGEGISLNIPAIVFAAALFACMKKWKIHVIAYIGIAAVVGILVGF